MMEFIHATFTEGITLVSNTESSDSPITDEEAKKVIIVCVSV